MQIYGLTYKKHSIDALFRSIVGGGFQTANRLKGTVHPKLRYIHSGRRRQHLKEGVSEAWNVIG